MDAIYFEAPGRLSRREVDPPTLSRPSAALLRPLAVATCDLDTAMLRGAIPHPPAPFAFGHEAVAEIVDTGDTVQHFQPGQQVVIPFQISCGTCRRCLSGRTGRCTSLPGLPMYGLGALGGDHPGMLADLVEVPYADTMLIEAPTTTPLPALASLSDNIPDAWRTVAPHLQAAPGASVLIVGGGAISIGLYAVAIAHSLGASTIHYLDHDDTRREQARQLGATPLTRDDRPPRSDITVDASGTIDGLHRAIARTELDGVCTSVSPFFEPVELLLPEMYTNGVHLITGRPHARHLLPEIVGAIDRETFDPSTVPTTQVPWDDALDALTEPPDKLVLVR